MATNRNFRVKNSITVASGSADEYTLPAADGSANQVLTTDGSGQLSFTNASVGITAVVDDTTPQLGGTLDANGNYIDMGANNITDTKVGQWDSSYTFTNAVTATASEVNILDGVTSTTAELNILDGVTSSTAEINILDGLTASTSELNIMDGVTSTTAELNHLDGVTGITLDNAGDLLIVGTDGTSVDSSDLLNIDTANGRLGIGTSTPARTLHLVGDTQFEGSMRIDQYHSSEDGPDLIFYKARGTPSAPVAVQTNDEVFKIANLVYNGSAFVTRSRIVSDALVNGADYGADLDFQTSASGSPASRLHIAAAGAITFNNAYTFPTSDGTANQVLQTDGSGAVSFATLSYNNLADTPTLPVVPTNISDFVNDSGYVVRDEVEEYSFRIGADDSTARLIDNGEQINIYGGTNISSTIDAEGNITINGTVQDFKYASLTGAPTNLSDFNNDAGYLTSSEEYNFKIGADDSTARTVDNGEQINILGSNGISTTSNAEGDITVAGNIDGLGGVTLGTQNEILIVGAGGNTVTSTDTLTIDDTNNYIGINQTSPAVTLHMTGESSQSAQIRMEQHDNSGDAPDIRTKKSRGTAAAPTKNNAGDFIFRGNFERYNGTSYTNVGQLAVDTNSTNADRFQLTLTVSEDGTSIDASDAQIKIDGNDSGAITFNGAYKFPTADGNANQVLVTNGSGTLSFATQASGGIDNVIEDTTPQLGGNLDVNGNSIVSASNGDIEITPNGTGQIGLHGAPQSDIKTHIRGSGEFRVGAYFDTDDRDFISLQADGTNSDIRANNNKMRFYNDQGDMEFYTNGTPGTDVLRLTIEDGGDIVMADTAADFNLANHDAGTNGLKLGGVLVTASAAEINILDGVTASTSELNIMDGVTSTTAELNHLDGITGITLGDAAETLIVGTDNTSITTTDLLAFDTANNRVGIGTTSPATKFHIAGEGSNEGQIRLQQANNGSDGPDIAFYTSRGTIATPSAVQNGDTHGRLNPYAYNGTSFLQTGSFGWSGTDGTGNNTFDIRSRSGGTLAKRLEVLSGGDIRFADAYTFPTADGTANQVLLTDGSGNLDFGTIAYANISGTPTIPVNVSDLVNDTGFITNAEEYSFKVGADDSTERVVDNGEAIKFIGGTNVTTSSDAEGNITINGPTLTTLSVNATATELNVMDGDTSATATTIVDADRVVLNDNGTMKQVAVTDLNTYFKSTVAGGSNEQVQYNNSGALAGSSNFTWDNDGGDDSNGLLTVQNTTVTNRLRLGGAGSQFFAFNEDTVRVKFANWYQADDHQYGMGMLWYETWIGALDQNPGAANRRIGFYLEQPNRGASNAQYGTGAHSSNGRGWFEIDHFGLSHLNPIRFYNDDQDRYTELRGGNSGTNRTITLPDASGTIALRDDPVVTIGADDSTARTVSFGEQINILGGDNVSTTSDAEGNITIVSTDVNLDTVHALTNGATIDIDATDGGIQYVTVGQNTTYTFNANWQQGHRVTLMIAQSTAYTHTWPTMKWAGGVAPTFGTNADYNTVEIWRIGTTYYGAYVGNHS